MFSCKLIFWCAVVAIVERASSTSDTFDNGPSQRILGGSNAKRGQFPYQVSLRLPDGRHFCSGAILNARWTITTGLCVNRMQPEMIIIFAGVYRHSKIDGLPYLVDRIEFHQKFQPGNFLNNLALLHTAYPIMYVPLFIEPIPLPLRDTAAGVKATVSGWGYAKVFFLQIQFQITHIFTYPILLLIRWFTSCLRTHLPSNRRDCNFSKRPQCPKKIVEKLIGTWHRWLVQRQFAPQTLLGPVTVTKIMEIRWSQTLGLKDVNWSVSHRGLCHALAAVPMYMFAFTHFCRGSFQLSCNRNWNHKLTAYQTAQNMGLINNNSKPHTWAFVVVFFPFRWDTFWTT